jgi:hypothetical protein
MRACDATAFFSASVLRAFVSPRLHLLSPRGTTSSNERSFVRRFDAWRARNPRRDGNNVEESFGLS